jgi:hypothetical protein
MKSEKCVIIPVKPSNKLYKELIALKTVMKFIDFKCEFGVDGFECRRTRFMGMKICCHDCSEYFGFLRFIPKCKLEMYMNKFDDRNGFLTSTGCSLSFEDRSAECLTYTCNAAGVLIKNKEVSDLFKKGMDQLKDLMESIEDRIIQKYKNNNLRLDSNREAQKGGGC